jgi:hypothetical protein
MFAIQYYYEYPTLYMAFQNWIDARKETDEARENITTLRTAYECRRVDATLELATLLEKDTKALHLSHIISSIEASLQPSFLPLYAAHKMYLEKRREEEEALNAYQNLTRQLIPLDVDGAYDE